MDCPAEEQLIRVKLQGFPNIYDLHFDLDKRQLNVIHTENADAINDALQRLNLDTTYIESIQTEVSTVKSVSDNKLLSLVLTINFSFFILELLTGVISRSMGLIADSLDMLADAIVYSMALFAVGGTVLRKNTVAKFAGYFQLTLALIGVVEVIRRFIGAESLPDFKMMIIISALALFANVTCLYILQKGKSKEAHMRASMIFTSNDIIINAGIILAGFLVNWLDSRYPDLIIGTIVFIIVVKGALRILSLSKGP